jgi:hypothetical protein
VTDDAVLDLVDAEARVLLTADKDPTMIGVA